MENEESLVRLIGKLSNEIAHSFNLTSEDNALTNKQRRVLHYIIAQTEHRHIFQRDIEMEFNIRRSSASNMLTNMEKAGFIRREGVNYDGRLKRITITEKGDMIKAEVLNDCKGMEARLVKNISAEDLDRCINVIKKMISNLKEN